MIFYLDPNKARGQNMVSIRMIKICGISIWRPLKSIFQSYSESGNFPIEWKQVNVVILKSKY